MKKSLILAGMLCIGYANAQTTDTYEGKVGINTNQPKATIDISPSDDNAKVTSTTNEGLLIPRLSKERVSKMTSPETSTKVYVNDITYTGTDTRVSEIDAVGFYHYNGTKWIKEDKYEWDRKKVTTGSYTDDVSYLINTDTNNSVTYNKQTGLFRINTWLPQRNEGGLWVSLYPTNVNGAKHESEIYGGVVSSVQTLNPNTQFSNINAGHFGISVRDNTSVDTAKGIQVTTNYTALSTNKESIGVYARANIYSGATLGNHTGVYSYIAATAPKTLDNVYYFRTGQQGAFSSTNMYGLYVDDINKGTNSNYAVYTNTGKVRVGDLKGVGDRAVYVDADGILKTGVATTGATTLTGEENLKCEEATRGKMNFVKDVTIGSGTGDAFAVCLKGTDGKYYWRYLYGAAGVTNKEGNFGVGL